MKLINFPSLVTQKLRVTFLIIVIIICTFVFINVFSESLRLNTAPPKTKANLKVSIKGEKTNSIKYSSYSSLLLSSFRGNLASGIAVLFKAVSVSDSILSAGFTTIIYNLGDSPDAFTNPIIDSSNPNFNNYVNDAISNDDLTYDSYETDARDENVTVAVTAFGSASEIRAKRLNFFQNALSALNSKDYSGVATEYFICSKCGNIYTLSNVPGVCDICGMSKIRFITIK